MVPSHPENRRGWLPAAMAVLAVSIAPGLVAPGLAAPATWQPIRGAGGVHGTMACRPDGAFCFGLACRRGGPMQWMVRNTGGLIPARGQITLSVDGKGVGGFAYAAKTSGTVTTAEARYSSVQHGAIADALKRGRRATVTVSGLDRPVDLPLEGAAREVERPVTRCGVPEGEPARPMTVPPTETRDHGALRGAVVADVAEPPRVGAAALASHC
jgi:hypothetical protein